MKDEKTRGRGLEIGGWLSSSLILNRGSTDFGELSRVELTEVQPLIPDRHPSSFCLQLGDGHDGD